MRNRMNRPAARGLWLVVVFVLSIGALVCTSCAAAPAREPIKSDPDFIAFIVEAKRSADPNLQGVIVAESHADKVVSRYLVRILDDTAIFEKAGESYRPARFSEFRAKQWIWVWFAAPAPDEFGASVDAVQIVMVGE